mmetsp:Transcript_35612/g.70184  ORF Transcript_35612/g.70184 Transcript_35612/m.70184 type:complete len:116 (-) Transcript_35612:406-753(-)
MNCWKKERNEELAEGRERLRGPRKAATPSFKSGGQWPIMQWESMRWRGMEDTEREGTFMQHTHTRTQTDTEERGGKRRTCREPSVGQTDFILSSTCTHFSHELRKRHEKMEENNH